MEQTCPNLATCVLVSNKDNSLSVNKHNEYLREYCHGKYESWNSCTRFRVKKSINFCPDFVLPDSVMTPDEVIDRFDSGNNN